MILVVLALVFQLQTFGGLPTAFAGLEVFPLAGLVLSLGLAHDLRMRPLLAVLLVGIVTFLFVWSTMQLNAVVLSSLRGFQPRSGETLGFALAGVGVPTSIVSALIAGLAARLVQRRSA
jgi:predicted neutral ceramidase superfamily lipid hydrolase